MNYSSVIGLVLCLAVLVSGRPKYYAIPVEDIQFLSFGPLPQDHHRVARQASAPLSPYAQAVGSLDASGAASEGRAARQAGGGHDSHDYVDYGAHTGHHGAFGWYADFPVHASEH